MTEVLEGFNETFTNLNYLLGSYGIHLPNWIYILILVLFFLGAILYSLNIIISFFIKTIKFVNPYFYDAETKDFVEIRNSFIGHLQHEVEKLNIESEWDDSLHYTELEAEVEVKQFIELNSFQSKNPINWVRDLFHLIINFRHISYTEIIEKNLTEAITNSKSQFFLLIGDPGSGKTVSLRHLFLEMSKEARKSKRKDVVIPIYLNLKELNIEPDKITSDNIHSWIIDQLVTGKDRLIRTFVTENFEQMLKRGQFFFLFDSFDEIPSVMDAQEDNEIIYRYSEEIDRFLHADNKRRGVVSSRPYRSPRKLDAQKITILPLSNARIKKALEKYLRQESFLAKQIWDSLLQREDLLHIVRNPFYLALLTQYCRIHKALPDRQFDLFEHFVQSRTRVDEYQLSHLGFTPDELMHHAEILAFAMTKTTNIGLEVDINQIIYITSEFDESSGWDQTKIIALLSALSYSKIGRRTYEEVDRPITFSFVHRRFHEYFCARYLIREHKLVPYKELASNNRWREILVLLCEVMPPESLGDIFELSAKNLSKGVSANSDSKEHYKALETILFLKDAFKSRIKDVPNNIRLECSNFIKRQFQDKNLLNQKRALEALILADNDSSSYIIESAFEQNSKYLNETIIRSCRILERVPGNILVAMRKILFLKYINMEIFKQNEYYSVLFLSSPALKPLNVFLQTLLISTIFQVLLIVGFLGYFIKIDPKNIVFLAIGTILFLMIYPLIPSFSLGSKSTFMLIFKHPISLFSVIMLLVFSFTFQSFYFMLLWVAPLVITYYLYRGTYHKFFWARNDKINFQSLKQLFVPIILSCGTIALILTIHTIIKNGNYTITLDLEEFKYIARVLGQELNQFAYIIIIADIIYILAIILLLIKNSFEFFYKYIYLNIKDKLLLSRIYYKVKNSSQRRKSDMSTTDALNTLNLFKTEFAKARYVQTLIDFLPIDAKNVCLIFKEANKNEGDVRDMLYQLAEIWENSIDK